MFMLPNLPAAVSREVCATLVAALPPPAIDTPQARADREETAKSAVASLLPANAAEANIAAQHVAADIQAKECMRRSVEPGLDAVAARQCRAQASSMLRYSQSALNQLLRLQAMREKAEAAMHPPAMERAGYWFRDATAPEPVPAEPAEPKLTRAEHYATCYPRRAALIRKHGGLPPKIDFGAPDPELVQEIVDSTSPILTALDEPGEVVAAAE